MRFAAAKISADPISRRSTVGIALRIGGSRECAVGALGKSGRRLRSRRRLRRKTRSSRGNRNRGVEFRGGLLLIGNIARAIRSHGLCAATPPSLGRKGNLLAGLPAGTGNVDRSIGIILLLVGFHRGKPVQSGAFQYATSLPSAAQEQ